MTYNKELSSAYEFEYTADTINTMSEKLSRHLVMAAKPYENMIIDYGDERYVNEIYGKAMTNLLKIKSRYLISREKNSTA